MFTSFLRSFGIKNIINILFTFFIKIISLKNILRIIFIYANGLLIRIILIKYFNVDVFHDYLSLYSNLYYLLMATFSVITFDSSNSLPD
jgi:hypothetical protein